MKCCTSLLAADLSEFISKGATVHFGITGHRDIESGAEVKERVRQAIDEMVAKYEPGKIVLHTPLASGADTLLQEVFLEGGDSWPKTEVLAVLPMERKEYAKDWIEDADSLSEEEFAEAWKAAIAHLETQIAKCDGERQVEDFGKEKSRNEAYSKLAPYYAKNCDLIFALWDGILAEKPGGTGDVVDTLQKGGAGIENRCRRILWLSVARTANPFPANEKFTWTVLPVDEPGFTRGAGGIEGATKRGFSKWGIWISLLLTVGFGMLYYLLSGTWETTLKGAFGAFFQSIGHVFGSYSLPLPADATFVWMHYLSLFFSLLFVVITAGKVLDSIFHFLDRWHLDAESKKDHDLVFGMGDRGEHLIEDCHLVKFPVIAFDLEPSASTEALCKRLSVPLVKEDAISSPKLKGDLLENARNAFVCTGDDASNIRIVHRLAKGTKSMSEIRNREKLVCSVGLKSPESFDILWDSLPEDHRLDVRIFNREAVTARAFLRDVPLDRFSSMPEAHGALAVVLGDSPQADEMLRQFIQIGHFEKGKRLRVVRVCENSDDGLERFVSQYPCFDIDRGNQKAVPGKVWLNHRILPEVEFIEMPRSRRGRMAMMENKIGFENWVTTVVACAPNPLQATELASDIAYPLEDRRKKSTARDTPHRYDIVLWFHFSAIDDRLRGDLERNLDRKFDQLHVRSFTDFLGPCNRACALGETSDAIARRINGHYCDVKLDNPKELFAKWNLCPEHDKDSSRQAAEHAWVKFRIRERLRTAGKTKDEITDELARIEHRRWCSELLLKGFRPLTRIPGEHDDYRGPTPAEIDIIDRWFSDKKFKATMKSGSRHIDLVPFDDLIHLLGETKGTEEQAKDLSQIRVLDELLFGLHAALVKNRD